jgi:hypothetical protein
MKTEVMQTEIKRAVHRADETARENDQQKIIYCIHSNKSSGKLKSQIGEILLLLLTSNGQPDVWLQLEISLRKFYEVSL